jgi:hypothetical protein
MSGPGSAWASAAWSEPLMEVSRTDAWFGWYFAPGGVVLGPALIITAFLLGGALLEKLTGKAVSSTPFKKKDKK